MKKLIVAIILVFASAAHAAPSALDLKRLSESPAHALAYVGYVLGVLDALDGRAGYCVPPEADRSHIAEATRQVLAGLPDAALAPLAAREVLVLLFRGPFKCTEV